MQPFVDVDTVKPGGQQTDLFPANPNSPPDYGQPWPWRDEITAAWLAMSPTIVDNVES